MRSWLVLMLLAVWPAELWAQEGGKEVLPPPRVAGPNLLLPYIEPMPQHGYRNVWQLYAVDSTGHFRPRVVMAPGGHAFYLYNGRPYPWTTIDSQPYMPYATD